MRSHLDDPSMRTLLVAILVKKLGGTVTITQADIDGAAHDQLLEEGKGPDGLVFTYVGRTKQ